MKVKIFMSLNNLYRTIDFWGFLKVWSLPSLLKQARLIYNINIIHPVFYFIHVLSTFFVHHSYRHAHAPYHPYL